jgi:hypothetical protein
MFHKNYGMEVKIKFKSSSAYGNTETTLHNVTEIHYNYRGNSIFSPLKENRIAFESTIHCTGLTYAIDDIERFSTYTETEKKESV